METNIVEQEMKGRFAHGLGGRGCKQIDSLQQAATNYNYPQPPSQEEAKKFDKGKARYDLIPPEALEGLALLFGMGAEKYDDRNWEKGMDWGRIFAALQRHVWKWMRGERYDTADGQHHLLSVIWCAMVLYTYEARQIGTDSRPEIKSYNPTFWRSLHEACSDVH